MNDALGDGTGRTEVPFPGHDCQGPVEVRPVGGQVEWFALERLKTVSESLEARRRVEGATIGFRGEVELVEGDASDEVELHEGLSTPVCMGSVYR